MTCLRAALCPLLTFFLAKDHEDRFTLVQILKKNIFVAAVVGYPYAREPCFRWRDFHLQENELGTSFLAMGVS